MSIPVNISGSRSAAVLGLSEYQSQVSVWLEIMESREPGFCDKNGYLYQPFAGNAATDFGTAFEDSIIELTEMHCGGKVISRQKYYESGYMTCHLDGEIFDDTIVEAKTTAYYSYVNNWGEPNGDRVPRSYQIQANHNMMLAGRNHCIMPVLVFPRRQEEMAEAGIDVTSVDTFKWASVLNEMGYLKFYHITANPELQSLMLAHYADFWNRYVIGRTEPPVRDYDDIKKLCRAPRGTIIADEFIERQLSEYDQITAEINEMTRRKDQIKTIAVEYMREQASSDGVAIDDDSAEKFILRSRDGKKLASYGKDKQGRLIFR